MNTGVCHSCLRESKTSFCRSCLKELTGGRRVSNTLSFSLSEFNDYKLRSTGKFSISGVQIKHLLKLEKNKFVLAEAGSEYILKPVPNGAFQHLDQVPANEHLTMQLARQFFGIDTAANAIVFMSDGTPAYVTKRFDFSPSGKKLIVEDFTQIAGLTEETGGTEYKYKYSYEGIAKLISLNVSASAIELEKYFRITLFNYLFSNGDAHLKNFSLYKNEEYGDYLLTPAYDLLCTRIHSPYESDLALDLFDDDFRSEGYKHTSKYGSDDFLEFARRLGIKSEKAVNILKSYVINSNKVDDLISRSFLSDELKQKYSDVYKNKLSRLSIT